MQKSKLELLAVIVAILVATITIKVIKIPYTKKTILKYEQMKKPVQLHWKEKNTFWYSVVLKDANGNTERFGNLSTLANYIGERYNIGDTIVCTP